MWILFSIDGCTYCKQLKAALQKRKISYCERRLEREERPTFIQLTGRSTAPQFGWTPSSSSQWTKSLLLSKTKMFYQREIPKVQWIGGYTDFVEMCDHAKTLHKEPWFQRWSLWCQHVSTQHQQKK
jgi:Glutaredoxin